MSIELPAIPSAPAADAPAAAWDVYLRIVALHTNAAQTAAVNAQTAQMRLVTEASNAHADLLRQLLAQPQPPSGFSESFVMSLLRLVLDKPEASGG